MQELSLEVTHDCALECIFCSSSAKHPSADGELTLEKVKELITDAFNLGAKVISISGGEPFLYKSLFEVLSFCEHLKLKVLLYTSGIIFDDNGCRISINQQKWIELSSIIKDITVIFDLQSHKKDVVEKLNSIADSYEIILKSINTAIDCGINCECHIVPMKANVKDLFEFVSFCKEIGLSRVSFLRFVPQGRGEENIDQLSLEAAEFLQLQYTLSRIKSEFSDFVRLGHPIDFLFTINSKCDVTYCRAGFDAPLVLPNGNVHVCPAWKCFDNYVAGNIFDNPLADIWNNSEYFIQFRKVINEPQMLGGICCKCEFLSSCRGGCTAQRILAFKKLNISFPEIMYTSPDPECPLVHNFELINYLKRKEEI